MDTSVSRRGFLRSLGAVSALGVVGSARGDTIHAPIGARNRPPEDMTVVGTYPSWSRYERSFGPGRVPLDMLTHLQYAYLTVNEDGSVDYADRYGDKRNLARFRSLKDSHPDTKMILSIGGFFASVYYSQAAGNATRRGRFARTAIELMREYDFDGLDLDWQYPGGGNPNNFTDENDVDRFTLLLQEVRRQLDRVGSRDGTEYELSITVSINPEYTGDLDVAGFAGVVDRVNVTAYDYTGPWEERTGLTAPLYNPFPETEPDNQFYSANAMRTWADQPIDSSKLNLSFTTYGRGFTGVGPENRGFDQPFEDVPEGSPHSEAGTYTYWDIEHNVNMDNEYEYYWHEDAAAPFLYSEADGEFVTYDNMRSIAEKAEFVRENDFGGMTMWDFYGDKDNVLLYTANSALAE